jgi:iron complex transport system substrate-binding protein
MTLSLAVLILLTGCGEVSPAVEASGSTEKTAAIAAPSESRTIRDMAGRTVTVPSVIRKVYSTGQPGVIMLYTLCPDKLLGWCLPVSDSEAEYLYSKYLSLPVLGLMQGGNSTANREEIMARSPDIILMMTAVSNSAAVTADEIQAIMNIPVVVADYALEIMPETYRFLGVLLDAGERGETLARYAEDVITTAKATASSIPNEKKLRVFYAQGSNGLQTAPSGSAHTEVIELVGGINVVSLQADSDGRLNVNMEQLLKWNPDMIITSYSVGHEGLPIYSDGNIFSAITGGNEGWRLLDAVKNRMVFSTPCYPYNWQDMPPSANRLIGILWLEGLLYPDFYSVNIKTAARNFYALFYNKDLTDTQIDTILTGATRS